MKLYLPKTLLCFFFYSSAFSQEVEMADIMRSNGKIYVVVAVLSTIFIGLMIYLYRMDQRVKNLEK
ncbi:MAG: CcmD family protein [Flavobacteriales bacterium]|nr:CcmD family protein [Flavobacteriales bacterium]|tara:strand:- start:5054 stop:5251 length:198 start_codon:yes stop_codon:yes gene_type:complete